MKIAGPLAVLQPYPMFPTHQLRTLFLLLICLPALAQQPVSVAGLRCENLTDPVALEQTAPRLSWSLSGPDRGIVQASYRILVASSPDKLARNEGDLWDSGVVMSERSVWVAYQGSTLGSRAECHWKVLVQTSAGTRSGWSAPARWSMGLLLPADRLAQWMGLEQTFAWDQPTAKLTRLSARYFRKEVSLPKPIRKAVAYVCGLGLYELYLNGTRIGTQVLAPGPTEFDKRVFYNTYDVTPQLRTGANAVGITLGNGRFFRMRLNQDGLPETTHYGLPRFWLQLEITYTDGTTQMVLSDPSWKATADGPVRANNEYDGEDYDATNELTGWNQTGFDESGWLAAERVSAPASRLESQPNPPIRIMQTLRPQSIRPVRTGVYMLDLGQTISGWLRLRVTGNRGTRLTLRFGETLNTDGTLYVDNLRSALQTDHYTLKGGDSEVWEPRFTCHGFRYVELSGFATPPTPDQFDGCVIYDDMASAGQLSTSSATLNQIIHNADWGIRSNYRGIPTDCPQRDERNGWLGDRTLGATGESFLYNNQALYAKWLGDIEDAQSAEGSVPDVAPAYWKLYTDNMTWPAAYITVANMLYDQFGDEAPIRAHYASMKRWIQYVDKYQQNYIYQRDQYGDWAVPPEAPDIIISTDFARTTYATVLGTTHYYHVLTLLARFAGILGNAPDQAFFTDRATRVREAFNTTFWNAEVRQYANNSSTTNILPLAFGMVPDDRKQRVLDNLVNRINGEFGGHISSGVVGMQWLMPTLTAGNQINLAYQLATNTTYPSWGYMSANGATTIWELWNGNTANPAMNSGNHVMQLGDLLIWLYENVAGIKAAEPAFHRISMYPTVAGDLTHMAATHTSPYGAIGSDWVNDAKGFRWTVTVPGNCRAEVAIPATDPARIWEGSQLATQATGVRFLRAEGNRVIFEVGSGVYQFSTAPPANLTLKLYTDKRVTDVGNPVQVYLTIRNDGPEPATNVTVRSWLAPNLSVVSAPGLVLTNGNLTGGITRLDPGNQLVFPMLLSPAVAGMYQQSAQVTGVDQYDPTSRPNSGTGDGEDDAATTDFRTPAAAGALFVSPNPEQLPLPPVLTSQPAPDPDRADLSLQLTAAQLVVAAGEVSSLSLVVSNQGGPSAGGISIRLNVPTGLTIGGVVGGAGAYLMVAMPGSLPRDRAAVVSVGMVSTRPGTFVVQAEVFAADMADPDSTPNNGFTNGEDDTSQVLITAKR